MYIHNTTITLRDKTWWLHSIYQPWASSCCFLGIDLLLYFILCISYHISIFLTKLFTCYFSFKILKKFLIWKMGFINSQHSLHLVEDLSVSAVMREAALSLSLMSWFSLVFTTSPPRLCCPGLEAMYPCMTRANLDFNYWTLLSMHNLLRSYLYLSVIMSYKNSEFWSHYSFGLSRL